MPTVEETAVPGSANQSAALLAGLRVLAVDQQIAFTQYIRYVLPIDGYVFWLRTKTAQTFGSLHYTTNRRQLEDETISINAVLLTTSEPVTFLNQAAPNTLWIGEYAGLRFAFSSQEARFSTGVHHYRGDAVYPAMASQLVDLGEQLNPDTLIVSNSLPAWLSIQSYAPQWLNPPNPALALFPSFLVPDNIVPPYGAVHITPSATQAQQGAAAITARGTQQLAFDKVRVTLYGATNAIAQAFILTVAQYTRDTAVMGFGNIPTVRDEKRTQAELGTLAMKKTIEFDVSYNQSTINTAARQLLREALLTFLPQPYGVP